MFNYKESVFKNRHTSIEKKISNSKVIQILPSSDEKGILLFHEDGMAHLVNENLDIVNSYQLTDTSISCVEKVTSRNRCKVILVADNNGNLYSFTSSLGNKRLLKQTMTPITSISDIGEHRVLISYPDGNNTVTVEMITPNSGNLVSSLTLEGFFRIVDFSCPSVIYGRDEGWLLAASDQAIIEIGFKENQLFRKSINHTDSDYYIDEIWCDKIGQSTVGKKLYPECGPEYEDETYASDIDEKISTISEEHGVRVITEGCHVYIKDKKEKVNLHIEFNDEVSFCKHLHWPKGRIILSGNDSYLRILDWRSNCSQFFSIV